MLLCDISIKVMSARERAIGFIELKDMDAGTISENLIKLCGAELRRG